jgi:hypothetical protein
VRKPSYSTDMDIWDIFMFYELKKFLQRKKRLDSVETIEQDPQKPQEIPPPKQPILKDVSISGRNCGAVKYLLKEHAIQE